MASDIKTTNERRASPRCPAEVSLRLAGRRFYITYRGDVSVGGVFLTTAIPLRHGERVELKFHLPDGAEVAAEGVVLDQRPEEVGLGVGVKFTKIDAKSAAAIEAWVGSALKGTWCR